MVGNKVEHEPQAPTAASLNEFPPRRFAPQGRFHLKETARRIAVVIGRCENRREPQCVDTKIGEVIKPLDQTPKRAAQAAIQREVRGECLTWCRREPID